jgi:hypothetical protein
VLELSNAQLAIENNMKIIAAAVNNIAVAVWNPRPKRSPSPYVTRRCCD